MTALVAGFFLVSYLLATGAIYRLAFSFYIPSKRFQRTRTEEITFSVLVTIAPFFFAWVLLCHTPLGHFPAFSGALNKAASYKLVLNSLLTGSPHDAALPSAYLRAGKEQTRFILWLWAFCFAEGLLFGRLVGAYGNYPDGSPLKFFCDKFLLNHVSEWELLFTTLPLPSDDPRQIVEVDALSSANILYRGRLVNWFTDPEGQLEGIFLEDARRFQRDELTRDRENQIKHPRDTYWRPIPGSKLYLTAGSLVNYNIRYVEPTAENILQQELGDNITITPLEDADLTPAPSPPPPQSTSR